MSPGWHAGSWWGQQGSAAPEFSFLAVTVCSCFLFRAPIHLTLPAKVAMKGPGRGHANITALICPFLGCDVSGPATLFTTSAKSSDATEESAEDDDGQV